MRVRIICLSIISLFCIGFIIHVILKKVEQSPSESFCYTNFHDNPLMDRRMRMMMAPHLLPVDHPVKPVLDSIFSKSRATENLDTLAQAGFSIFSHMQGSFIVVAKHPDVPGYLFKLYLDSETRSKKNKPHWEWLTKRCMGAVNIRKVIKEEKLRHFTVPDKWLYILPLLPISTQIHQQPVILIETDMELESDETNKLAWKNISYEHLDELYSILKNGYGNTGLLRNIPYTKKGTFAFIDTEYPIKKHDLSHPNKFFTEEMQKYWTQLIKDQKTKRSSTNQ